MNNTLRNLFLFFAILFLILFLAFPYASEGRTVRSGPWDSVETKSMKLEGSTISSSGPVVVETGTVDLNALLVDVQSALNVGGSVDIGTTLDVTGIGTFDNNLNVLGNLDVDGGVSTFFSNGLLTLNQTELNNSLAVLAFGLGGVGLYSGPAVSGNSGLINGLGGALSFQSTDTVSENSGAVAVLTGGNNGAGAFNTGPLTLTTGYIVNASGTGVTGNNNILTGANYGSGDSGVLSIGSGLSQNGNSGQMFFNSGPAPSGNSGSLTVQSGDAATLSGDILIRTGLASTGGALILKTDDSTTDGDIRFQDGSQGTPGQVWTSSDASGTGSWAAIPPSGDAWGDPVDANIVPDVNGTRDIGVFGGNVFNEINGQSFQVFNFGDPTSDVGYIFGSGTAPNEILQISASTTKGTDLIMDADGFLRLTTNRPTGSPTTEGVEITTGAAQPGGLSGDIKLSTGSSDTNRGDIYFNESSLSAASNGYVWTLVDNASGEGAWQVGGAGGTSWSDPVDANILPDTADTYLIGKSGNEFLEIWSNEFWGTSFQSSGPVGEASFDQPIIDGEQTVFDTGDVLNEARAQQITIPADGFLKSYGLYVDCGGAANGIEIGIQADNGVSNRPDGTYINGESIFLDPATNCAGTTAAVTTFSLSTPIPVNAGDKLHIVYRVAVAGGSTLTLKNCTGGCIPEFYNVDSTGDGIYNVQSTAYDVSFETTTETVGLTENVIIGSGNGTASGLSTFSSGAAISGTSGDSVLGSGNATGGNSGNVILKPGTSDATRGAILFQDGSEGVADECWVSTDANGSGNWAECLTGGPTFDDSLFEVVDLGGDGFGLNFDVSAVTGANKTITMPDAAVDLGQIATNASNISTNAGNISTNTSNISTNAGNISTNTGNISTNTGNISTNTTAIGTIDAPTNYIAGSPGVIGSHLDGIDTELGTLQTGVSNKAERDLSNLTGPTAINQVLTFAESFAAEVQSGPGGTSVSNVSQPDTTSGANLLDSGDVLGESRGQGFTAPATGTITEFNVPWYCSGVGQIRVGIMSDNGGGLPDGVYLASTLVDISSGCPNSFPTYNTFTMDAPANVVSGNVYYIVMEITTVFSSGGVDARWCPSGGCIPENYVINLTGGSWQVNTNLDLAFDIDVNVATDSADLILSSGDSDADTGDVILRPGATTETPGFIFADGESRSATTTETINADDFNLVVDSDIVFLNSDSAVSTDRTIVLPTPQFAGQKITLVVTNNAVEIADTGIQVLSSLWTGTATDTLTLLSDGTNWVETARSNND